MASYSHRELITRAVENYRGTVFTAHDILRDVNRDMTISKIAAILKTIPNVKRVQVQRGHEYRQSYWEVIDAEN